MPRRVRINAAAALAVSALAAALVAVLRYRATDVAGAAFDKPLSDGTTRVLVYENVRHWYGHFELWLALALLLATASILFGLFARSA